MKKKILLLLLMVGPFVTGSVANAQGESRSSSVESENVQTKEEAKPIKPVNQADTVAPARGHSYIGSTTGHPMGRIMDVIGNDTIYILAETTAEFPGGMKKRNEYLSDVRYPEEAMLSGIQGIVYVEFVVRKDGSIDGFKVIRSAHPLLDKEALRVVSGMPGGWRPATMNGEYVNSYYEIPIKFQLSGPNDIYPRILRNKQKNK